MFRAALCLLAAGLPAAELRTLAPMRWFSAEAQTLRLLEGSPVNCLLLEPGFWQAQFIETARGRSIAVFGVVRSATEVEQARGAGLDGLVVEGDAEGVARAARAAGKPVVELRSRARLALEPGTEIVGTTQGLWPGIRVEQDGKAKAAPTGGPWIETNTGFLRFVRAAAGQGTTVWMGVRPPENTAWSAARYEQVIADTAQAGARWVVALDRGLEQALARGDARALRDWARIKETLAFFERSREYNEWAEHSELALVQDAESGALYSGGFVDMIVARHIPAEVVPARRVMTEPFEGVKLVLNIDPAALSAGQKEKLLAVARKGATLVNGPPGWKVPAGGSERITLPEDQVKGADEAWREINSFLGRRNFGVRLFGAPGTLSSLKISPDGKRLALHLVNYTDYPVESISAHFTGKWTKATLLAPRPLKAPELYAVEDGTGVDIPKIESVAILVLE